jgi:hypothetical protein
MYVLNRRKREVPHRFYIHERGYVPSLSLIHTWKRKELYPMCRENGDMLLEWVEELVGGGGLGACSSERSMCTVGNGFNEWFQWTASCSLWTVSVFGFFETASCMQLMDGFWSVFERMVLMASIFAVMARDPCSHRKREVPVLYIPDKRELPITCYPSHLQHMIHPLNMVWYQWLSQLVGKLVSVSQWVRVIPDNSPKPTSSTWTGRSCTWPVSNTTCPDVFVTFYRSHVTRRFSVTHSLQYHVTRKEVVVPSSTWPILRDPLEFIPNSHIPNGILPYTRIILNDTELEVLPRLDDMKEPLLTRCTWWWGWIVQQTLRSSTHSVRITQITQSRITQSPIHTPQSAIQSALPHSVQSAFPSPIARFRYNYLFS